MIKVRVTKGRGSVEIIRSGQLMAGVYGYPLDWKFIWGCIKLILDPRNYKPLE